MIDHRKDGELHLATQLGTREPGIFKTLKQTWFGPMAEALVAR